MRSSKYGLGLAVAAACLACGATSASAATIKVLPGDVDAAQAVPTKSWSFADTRTSSGGTALFQTGPKITPLGGGSLALNTAGDNNGKAQLLTNRLDGTKLSDIDGIGYSTFRKPTSTGFAAGLPAINIRVDLDGAGAGTATRNLVFEPYGDLGNAAVQDNVWQEWDAYDNGAATYWASGDNTGNALAPCQDNAGRANRCSIKHIAQDLIPNATIVNYAFGVNLGSFQPNLKTNVDGLYMSVNGTQSTFDFEQEAGPTGPTGATGGTGPAGPSGTSGTSGVFTPAGVTTKKVTIASRSLRASKKRKVRVGVSCARTNGLCEGSVKLVRSGKVIARQAFLVRGGRSGTVTLGLSKSQYRRLGKSKKVNVDVFSRDITGAASSSTKKLTLKK